MSNSTTVALLGGAGKAGGYLTFQLLKYGYKVKRLSGTLINTSYRILLCSL
jgi:hypothetical protein